MMEVLLGLDFGEKRMGVAVTDEAGIMALPLKTIEVRGRKQLLEELTRLVEEYRVKKIIVGLPKTLKGEIGPAAKKIMEQVEWLKGFLDRPWIFWDERLSTGEVERVLLAADLSRAKRKEVRDRLAAQRILQNYIEYHQKSGN